MIGLIVGPEFFIDILLILQGIFRHVWLFGHLAIHGCWSWLVFDGPQGERHAYAVLERH